MSEPMPDDDREAMREGLAEAMARRAAMSPEERAQLDAEHAAEQQRIYDEKMRALAIANAKRLSNVGERFADRLFSNYYPEPGCLDALDTAIAVAEKPGDGSWFAGGGGLGKTHLAAAIVNTVTERGVPATFLSTIRFFDKLKATYKKDGQVREGEDDIIRKVAAVRVLVFDDIDKPTPTEWFGDRMWRLADERYEHKLPVIITSNLMPSEFLERWRENGGAKGYSAIDRLLSMTRYVVTLEGDSYRLRKPKYSPMAICDQCGHLNKSHDPEAETCMNCPDDSHDFKPVIKNGVVMTPRSEKALYEHVMEQSDD